MIAFASDLESQRISFLPMSRYREHALSLEGSSKPPMHRRHHWSMAKEPASPIAEPETAALNTASRYRDGAPTDREIIHTRREIVSRSCAVAKECGGVTGTGRNQAIAVSGRLPDGPDWSGSTGPSQVLPIESGRSGAFPPKEEGRPQPARHAGDCRTNKGVRPG
jgi:hypothetical protein